MACDVSTASTVFISLTLVESLLMVLVSIFYILMYNCNVSGFQDFLNYIEDYSCGNHSATDTFILTPKTFNQVQIYSIFLYIIWFVICCVILSQLCCCKSKMVPSYIVWIVTCAVTLLTDLAIGTIVTLDYQQDDPDGPNLAVVLLSFKGGIGIALNIVALIVVSMVVARMKRTKKKQQRKEKVNAAPSRGTSEMREKSSVTPNLPPPVVQRRNSLPTREVVEEIEWNQKMRAANHQRAYNADPINSRQYSGPVPYEEPPQPVYGMPYDDRRVQPVYRQPSRNTYDYNRNPYKDNIPEQPAYNNQNWNVKNEPPYRRTNFRPITNPTYEEDNTYRSNEETTKKTKLESESSDSDQPIPDERATNQPLVKEKEPIKTPISKQFDPRPFSYINPTFRPTDHMDVKAMEEHPVDTFKVLVQEVKQLREKQRERRDSLATSVENDSRPQSPIHNKSEDTIIGQITAV